MTPRHDLDPIFWKPVADNKRPLVRGRGFISNESNSSAIACHPSRRNAARTLYDRRGQIPGTRIPRQHSREGVARGRDAVHPYSTDDPDRVLAPIRDLIVRESQLA